MAQREHRGEPRRRSGADHGRQPGQQGQQQGWGAEAGYGGWAPRVPPGTGAPREAMPPGPHRGKGPKGYRRPDERIREDVCDLLEQHPDIDPSDVEVHVQEGIVTLSGLVDSRPAKRLCEDVAETVPGVKDVNNYLRISQGRLDQALNDLAASGTTAGRGTTGAGGPMPEASGRARGPASGRPPARSR